MPTVRLPPLVIRSFSMLHRWTVQATGGRALTRFKGEPMILLTTTGRKTGKPRTWPLTGLTVGDGWVVAGSNGGHDHHPAWYLNLVADPHATVTDGRRAAAVTARVAEGAERAETYRRFVDYLGVYADYEKGTTREIPVVFLEPVTR
jgi:deazaflavin-dependent oxidoreductase (nitroreductase family)